MIDITQIEWVKKQLKAKGFVTRNEALQTRITRLGAIICDLKKAGWDIEGGFLKTERGEDYKYTLGGRPTKRVSRVEIRDGKAIETFVDVPV